MSRHFTHDFATDYIAFAPGNAASLDGGPTTAAFLWKADAVKDYGLLVGRNAGSSTVLGVNPASDGHNYLTTSAGFKQLDSWAGGVWYLFAVTKAGGSSTPRSHTYNYDTATWAHTDAGSALGDATNGPVTEYRVGWFDSADRLGGKLAAVGLWGSVLTDGNLEGMTASLGAWSALSPAALWGFNQASVATAVTDLTGGGADQNDISGTDVSADEPAGWSYSLGATTQAGRWGVHI